MLQLSTLSRNRDPAETTTPGSAEVGLTAGWRWFCFLSPRNSCPPRRSPRLALQNFLPRSCTVVSTGTPLVGKPRPSGLAPAPAPAPARPDVELLCKALRNVPLSEQLPMPPPRANSRLNGFRAQSPADPAEAYGAEQRPPAGTMYLTSIYRLGIHHAKVEASF